MDNNWISLCSVKAPDKNNDILMERIADCVDGTLIPFYPDKEKDPIHDNRELLFCNNGPQQVNNIGLWKWREYQNKNRRWDASATYMNNPSPIEIFIFDAYQSVEEIIRTLKTGLHIPEYVQGRLLFAIKEGNIIKGILCGIDELSARFDNQNESESSIVVTVKNSVSFLPYYEISDNDTIIWESKQNRKYNKRSRRIYNRLNIGDSRKTMPLLPLEETVKILFIERLTWPLFKAEGISKSDWRKVIELLKSIPKDTMIEQLAATYDLSVEESQERIESFLHTVEQHIDVEDVDSGLIVKMLDSHRGFKETCNRIAYQKWLEEHQADIAAAQEEVDEIRRKGEEETKAAELRLSAVKKTIVEAENERSILSSRIEQAEGRLDELQEEIKKYEKLGNDTVEAVRKKISDSQQDVAGFIADLSMFLPQAGKPVSSVDNAGWRYVCSKREELADEVEITENWNDEINLLSQNLSYSLGVATELCEMLSAVLYSAFINRCPLLIIGPGGQEVADCLSSSLFGSCSGKLIIGEGIGYDVSTTVNGCDEQIVSACNMFGKGWNDELPQILSKCNKQIIWTHPYAEDMLIEPKGIYNYMIPVLSEVFAESIADFDYLLGKRSEDFKELALGNNIPILIEAIKQLGISKLLLNHIELVLSGAKAIMGNESRNKDLEILFGLLPLSVLTDKTDLLKETIDNESGISEFVKEIATRYCDEG